VRNVFLVLFLSLLTAPAAQSAINRGQLIDDVREIAVIIDKTQKCPAQVNWDKIENDIQVKLTEAGFARPLAEDYAKSPSLRAIVLVLETEPNKTCVISCQLDLERLVCIPDSPDVLTMAPVWQSATSMEALAISDVNASLAATLNKQVDSFIKAHHAAMIKARNAEKKAVDTMPRAQTAQVSADDIDRFKSVKASAEVDGIYICSKSSKVYHKEGCPGAARITQQNKIVLKGKAAAGQSGRRPCKICNP